MSGRYCAITPPFKQLLALYPRGPRSGPGYVVPIHPHLRVALSRPTERLLSLDVAPEPATVSEVARLLRPPADIALHRITAEALRIYLEEDERDIEEYSLNRQIVRQ